MLMCPVSGSVDAAKDLMRVDLPDPFSPRRQRTSPVADADGHVVKGLELPAKVLVMPLAQKEWLFHAFPRILG